MAVPTPQELIDTYGACPPEQLAVTLRFQVRRLPDAPTPPAVTVLSEYQPHDTIILYTSHLAALARQRREPMSRVEQWHIAHELYHGLAEQAGASPWRVRETEADLWADELLVLMGDSGFYILDCPTAQR
jgi:hypothetical protein